MSVSDIISAIYRRDYQVLALQLQGEAVNERDAHGFTPLIHAILATPVDATLVAFLLAHGADANLPDGQDRWTPLHFAAREQKLDILEMLLAAGANIDAIDSRQRTPLWRSVWGPGTNKDVVLALLRAGADPERPDQGGLSPREVANAHGKPEIVGLFDQFRRASVDG